MRHSILKFTMGLCLVGAFHTNAHDGWAEIMGKLKTTNQAPTQTTMEKTVKNPAAMERIEEFKSPKLVCPAGTTSEDSILQIILEAKDGTDKTNHITRRDISRWRPPVYGAGNTQMVSRNKADLKRIAVIFGAFDSATPTFTCPNPAYFVFQVQSSPGTATTKTLPYEMITAIPAVSTPTETIIEGCHYKFIMTQAKLSELLEKALKDNSDYISSGGNQGGIRLNGQVCASTAAKKWSQTFYINYNFGYAKNEINRLEDELIYTDYYSDMGDYSWDGFVATP